MTKPEPLKNVDLGEVAKFEALASRWWDPESEFKPLHDINPLRANWIDKHAAVAGKRVADIGCGGGLLSEALAQRGANRKSTRLNSSHVRISYAVFCLK